jgi:hypothetical protein
VLTADLRYSTRDVFPYGLSIRTILRIPVLVILPGITAVRQKNQSAHHPAGSDTGLSTLKSDAAAQKMDRSVTVRDQRVIFT